MKTIVFTGGGTAGHIMPNIAIIEKLHNFKIYYLGSSGMEKDILKSYHNVNYIEIPVVKFKRSLTPHNLLIPFKLFNAIKATKKILAKISPDIIFSKGGYVSIPVCLAGARLNIPILTHESDYTIGLANKIIAKKAQYICCSFSDTAENYGKNAIFTGSPIRQKILNGNSDIIKDRHNIHTNKPIILIVGGSLGAQSINQTIWNNIKELSIKYSIIHIVGKGNVNNEANNTPNYTQIEFANDIENYFAISDIVISRAGSNTIFELLALKKPMILIPLPKSHGSRGDQCINADYFKRNNFANVINQEELNIQKLLNSIKDTLNNKNEFVLSMSKYSTNNGTSQIINLINKHTD